MPFFKTGKELRERLNKWRRRVAGYPDRAPAYALRRFRRQSIAMLNRQLIVVFVPLAIISDRLRRRQPRTRRLHARPVQSRQSGADADLAAVHLPVPGARHRHDRRQPGDLGQAGPLPQAGAPARSRGREPAPGGRPRAGTARSPVGAGGIAADRSCRRRRGFLSTELFMLTISAAEVDRALTFPGLVETLREAFAPAAVQPVRHHSLGRSGRTVRPRPCC